MIERRRGTHAYLLLALFLLGMLFPGGGVQAATSDGEKTAANQFSDVSSSDLNGIYISYLTAREILEGFPDGSFHPQEGLTRAQAAIVICKALNMEIKSGETDSGFKDVAKDYWAAAYIAAAVKAGYLKGFPDGNYKPEEKLSRAQGVSLTLRLSKQSDPGVALPQLRDMDNNHWAARSFAVAIDAGMIQPNSEKKIEPDSPLSRGDLSRALALLLTKDPVLSSCSLNSTLKVNSGDVKLSRKGGQAGEKVSGTAQIGAGDTVETEANGEAVINYPDGSSFLLKNDSKLVIKESQGRAYIKKNGQPGIAVDNLEVELKVGKLFGGLSALALPAEPKTGSAAKTTGINTRNSKLLAAVGDNYGLLAETSQGAPWYKTAQQQKVRVKVDMPWGVAAVRGSFWYDFSAPNGSGGTNLLEGSAQVIAGGQTVSLSPGQATGGSGAGAPPSAPVPMTAQQLTEWFQAQTWLQQTAAQMVSNQGAPGPDANPAEPGQTAPAQILTQTINQALSQAGQAAAATSTSNNDSGESSSTGKCSLSPTKAAYYLPNMFPGPAGTQTPGKITIPVTVGPLNGTSITWTESGNDVIDVSSTGVVPDINIVITCKQDSTGFRSGKETVTFTVTAAGYSTLTRTMEIYALPPLGISPSYVLNSYSAPLGIRVDDAVSNLWQGGDAISLKFIGAGTNNDVIDTSGNPVTASVTTFDENYFDFNLNSVLPVGQYEYVICKNGTPVAIGPLKVFQPAPGLSDLTVQSYVYAGYSSFGSLFYSGADHYMFRTYQSELPPPSLNETLGSSEWVVAKATTLSPSYDPGSPFAVQTGWYVQVAAVDASNRVLAYTSHPVITSEIGQQPPDTFSTPPSFAPGIWVSSTKLSALADEGCTSFKWLPLSSSFSAVTPAVYANTALPEFNSYTNCIETYLAGMAAGKHVGMVGLGANGQVVKFIDHTLIAGEISNAAKSATLTVGFGFGDTMGTTRINNASTGTYYRIIIDDASPPYDVALGAPAGSTGTPYNMNSCISVSAGKHVWIFALDSSYNVMAFTDHVVLADEVCP